MLAISIKEAYGWNDNDYNKVDKLASALGVYKGVDTNKIVEEMKNSGLDISVPIDWVKYVMPEIKKTFLELVKNQIESKRPLTPKEQVYFDVIENEVNTTIDETNISNSRFNFMLDMFIDSQNVSKFTSVNNFIDTMQNISNYWEGVVSMVITKDIPEDNTNNTTEENNESTESTENTDASE